MTTFTKSLGGSVTARGSLATNPLTVVGRITPTGALTLSVSVARTFTGRIAMSGYESPLVAGGGAQEIESGGSTLRVGGLLRGPQ